MITLLEKKERRGKVTLEFSNQLSITLVSSDPRLSDYQCGVEYSRDSLEALQYALEIFVAERKLSDSLARGPKSSGQARAKLREKGFSPEVIDETIERFIHAGFLDDRRFALETVKYLLANKPAGYVYLRSVLLKKLVNAELAEEALSECFAAVDETALAESILRKSWWRLRELTLETARQKAYTQLARKSIGFAASQKAFERLAAEEVGFETE